MDFHWQAEYLVPGASALLSLVFLLFLPLRIHRLRKSTLVAQGGWLLQLKIAVYCCYIITCLGMVVWLGTRSLYRKDPFQISAASLAFFAAVVCCWLSVEEHRRVVRPPDYIVLFLIATSICDAVWLSLPLTFDRPLGLALCLLLFKILLITVESRSKTSLLLNKEDLALPCESRSGILSRTFFWWTHDVLAEGYTTILENDKLPSTDRTLGSARLRALAVEAWDNRAMPDSKMTLPKVLLRCLASPFLAAIIPRLSLIVFRYAQPVLISRSIRYVAAFSDTREDPYQGREGYWIVFSAIIIYFGLAVSTATYKHKLNRLRLMTRGALIGLIHHKALNSRNNNAEDGRAVTLMGTDVPGVYTAGQMFHETWSQVIECIVGIALLATQVGWLWPLPLVMMVFCSRVSRYVAKHLKDRQTAWNVGTQQRIAATSSMLGGIRNVKMLGLQNYVFDQILGLRQHELAMANKFRWMMVAYNASANALGLFAPVLTVILYAALAAARGSRLDTETAFTTIAIIGMVTHPANMVMTIVPRAIASFSSFERIHSYLTEPSSHDQRLVSESRGPGFVTQRSAAIHLENVTISNAHTSQPILRDLNLNIDHGAVVICSGQVGSGKSSLARVVLGDVAPLVGTVCVSSKRIAYCSQIPWLPNRSVKDCVYGVGSQKTRDVSRYKAALEACCLDEDLREFHEGDNAIVGNEGLVLSGGQRQRVALARAIYSNCDIVVLDDSFSALDGRTESQVIENLLGPVGLLRKTGKTVLWITNSTLHFPLADKIVVLADSTIKEEGTWESLGRTSAQIAKIIHHNPGQTGRVVRDAKDIVKEPSQKQRVKEVRMDWDRRDGDLSLYGFYFKAAGIGNILFMVLCTAMTPFFTTFPNYWLKWWTESEADRPAFYITGYVLLLLAAYTWTNGIMWSSIIRVAPTSGEVLHRRLLAAIMGAPLLYFSQNDSGGILNRFSQDIQLVDKEISIAMHSLSVQVFKITVQAALLFAVQYYMALSLPLSAMVVYIVQKVYLRTSRQLRLLELESRSAVYSSFLETIRGISTIKAFQWEGAIAEENTQYLDDSQKPFYLLLCVQRWLNMILNLLIAVIAVGTIWLAIAFRDTTTGAQVGVAMNVILVANSTLLKLVENWTNLEIALGAIARLKGAEQDTPKEEDLSRETLQPVDQWPQSGKVEFVDVTAAYNDDAVVLRKVSLSISPGQTVVVCGRTGSGKSSLLSSLLRLLDIQGGRIEIDDVDLSYLPRSVIRQRCFVTVSQDVLFLPQAAIRFNLDPSENLPNESLVNALEKTGLWPIFSNQAFASSEVPVDADLNRLFDRPFSSLPTLSVGQTQLLALTRALLQMQAAREMTDSAFSDYPITAKRRPILLLDEVTSALDPDTEAKVYDVIQQEFIDNGHTVIMVTHKLGLFKDRMRPDKDKIVWMADGKIERVGDVGDLMQFPKSHVDPAGDVSDPQSASESSDENRPARRTTSD